MADPKQAPWDLYSKTMFNHYGLPLWHADPEVDESFGRREVELGSVGFLDRGKFRHLFNARKDKDDLFNKGRVPETFKKFNPSNMSVTAPEPVLRQPYVASGSIRQVIISLEANATSPVPSLVSAGGSLSFECKQDLGAALLLNQPAYGQSIPTRRHIVTYLRRHIDSIYEYVTEGLGYDLQMQDIKFVSGTLKTAEWACAVFSGSYRNKCGSLNVNLAGAAGFELKASIDNQLIPNEFYNNGPSFGPVGTTPRSSFDQCIFFHYFAVKKRSFILPHNLEVGAGPYELSPEDPEDEGDSPVLAGRTEYDFLENVESSTFDPVAILLDYMLSKTEAEYAIASDRDVLAIFGPAGVPDDIMAGLEAKSPQIEVDENDVATVNVDTTRPDQQTSVEAAAQGSEEVSGDPTSTEQVEDTQPGALLEPEVEQTPADATVADAPPAEEGEGGNNNNNNNNNNAGTGHQPVWNPAVVAHTGSVTSLAVSPDSQWVASGSDDTIIILWEAETQSVVRKWESHDDIVWHLAFSSDSLRLASSGGEGRIMVWDVDTGEHLATMEGHTETIHTVVWSPDGTKLASGSDDMTVRIWDAQTYQQIRLLEGHDAMVTFVLFSHNGRYLASGGADYNTRIWDVATGTLHKELSGHRGMVWKASFDPEDNRIATASDDASVRIWKVETGEELVVIHEHHGPVWVVAFSQGDGKQILSGSSDATLKICDSFTGKRVVALEGHDSMINSATFSPDGRFVASASSDNTVRLWRRSDGTNLKTFNEHNDKVTHALFSPDGATLSSGSDDGTVRIRMLRDFVDVDE